MKIEIYQPNKGVNFLRERNRRKKILYRVSLWLVISSSLMLVYPFSGSVYYFILRQTQTPASNESVVQKIETINIQEEIVIDEPEPINDDEVAVVAGDEFSDPLLEIIEENIIDEKIIDEKIITEKIDEVPIVQNRLVIDKIGVQMDIKGGNDANVLKAGAAWWIPGTSNPLYGGNFVVGGHRYAYQPPSAKTLYNLDKLVVGDVIKVEWEGKEYSYEVQNIKIVEPSQVEILAPTSEEKLTLFTCTPIFTSKQRLVVEAVPI